jgi:malate synthase
MTRRAPDVLSPGALALLARLHEAFEAPRRALLERRAERQRRFDAGDMPDFPAETAEIRNAEWRVAPIPDEFLDRRVEIAGPPDRGAIAAALRSGAKTFMADFEDASSPSWVNLIDGQANLMDLWAGRLPLAGAGDAMCDPRRGPAVMMRPRGWHMPESHVRIDGEPIAAALFDMGLYLFHNAAGIVAQGRAPGVYLPKIEGYLEARLWNDVLTRIERELGLPDGTVKATALIETIPAAFEMDEILWELRGRATALNCGRWDLIFSFIKCLGRHARFVTPDRASMVMGSNFLASCSYLLIKTCHRRGALALGGKAANLPVTGDPSAHKLSIEKLKADKQRAVLEGLDGVWVSHPDLVPVAAAIFDKDMPQANQLGLLHDDMEILREDILSVHPGRRTEAGLRNNVRVAVRYLAEWLSGRGAVPLYNLMEDAGTAEIARIQLWQWVFHRASLSDGRKITPELFSEILEEETARLLAETGPDAYASGRFAEAVALMRDLTLAEEVPDFLTLPAYKLLAA